MKILWLTWKDKKNPLAGGAEIVNEELAKRLVVDGHEVIFLVAGYDNSLDEEIIDGYKVIRLGNRWTVYFKVWQYFRENLDGWADLVIDEVNTIPFFAKFYMLEKNILFVHQLCREIWFYQIFFPLNLIGYLLEPIYLWMLNDRKVITVSESTKKDLMRFGFKAENISIISEGIELEPLSELASIESDKFPMPTILSLGSVRPMKRTMDIVEAFELARYNMPQLRLKIAGDMSGVYGEKVRQHISKSEYKDDIEILGKVSPEKRLELMKKSHLLVVTSVKEGWGLVVSEAASQGTPAVVYDVDGLRDSVRHNDTGVVCQFNNPDYLALDVLNILSDRNNYERLRRNAWMWSREINFEKSYDDFRGIINL